MSTFSSTDEESFDNTIFEFASVTKIKIADNKLTYINNYGIYDYFDYSDNIYRSKMIAALVGDNYIIETGHADRCDHYELGLDIKARFGSFQFYIASVGDELNFFKGTEDGFNSRQINVLLDVVQELQSYYVTSKKNKKISFIGKAFGEDFQKIKSCEQLDELIILLNELKKIYNNTFELNNFFDDDEKNLFI